MQSRASDARASVLTMNEVSALDDQSRVDCGSRVDVDKCVYPWCPSHAKAAWAVIVADARKLAADLDQDDGSDRSIASNLHDRRVKVLEATHNDLFRKSRHIQPWQGESVDDILRDPISRWSARRAMAVDAENREAKLATLAAQAEIRARWRRVAVDGVDITDHVAAMFDTLVGSLDWGSGFLDEDEIDSILTVADLVGLEPPEGCDTVKRWRAQRVAASKYSTESDQ